MREAKAASKSTSKTPGARRARDALTLINAPKPKTRFCRVAHGTHAVNVEVRGRSGGHEVCGSSWVASDFN